MSSVDVAGVVGDHIGDWVVEDLIAFGEPQRYLCRRQTAYGEESAVLTIAAVGSELEAALEREHDALRLLEHEGLPTVLDFGRDAERGVAYLATDFFDGDSLADWLITGPLDWRDACQLIRKVADALHAVHAHSLVHRDVSPSKILVGSGWDARLVGFEVALDASQSAAHTELPPGQITYVAPEVIAQDDYGPRADLYALGVVFYEAITGRPAFPAALRGDRPESNKRVLGWKTRAEPLDPGESAPPWLTRLIQKATHPEAAERLPDMEAFIGWLDAAEYAWKKRKSEPEPMPVSTAASAPPPIQAVPTFAAPTPPSAPERSRETVEVTEVVQEAGLSPAMSYLVAVVLGVFAAFGFSALVIVIAEVTLRG